MQQEKNIGWNKWNIDLNKDNIKQIFIAQETTIMYRGKKKEKGKQNTGNINYVTTSVELSLLV